MKYFSIDFNRPFAFNTLCALLASGLWLTACGSQQVKKDDTKPAHRLPPQVETWRKERPKAGVPAKLKLPVVQKTQLQNGLTLLVVQEKNLPIVDVRLVLRGGADQENIQKAGLVSLVYDLLDEGAGEMDAVALADAQQSLGMRIHTRSGRESGSISMGVLKRNLDEGLNVFQQILQKPRFAKADFTRIKNAHEARLIAKKGNPRAVAFELFAASIFGAEHPYGHAPSGTVSSLRKLKNSDVKKFWKQNAGPQNAALILTGDVSVEEATQLAEAHFGKWKSRAKTPKKVKDAPEKSGLAIVSVPFAGAAQTMILVGRPLLKAGDPDEIAALVFNQILGGMFTSRLNLNLREEHGYSYGAFSYLDARAATGPFLAGSAVEAKNTAAALQEVLKEFALIETTPVSEAELKMAQDNAIKSLPADFETLGAMGNAAERLFLQDLPNDYYQKLPERIAAISLEDVARVAKRACKKDGLQVVLVGPAEAVLAPIQALNIGEFSEHALQ